MVITENDEWWLKEMMVITENVRLKGPGEDHIVLLITMFKSF